MIITRTIEFPMGHRLKDHQGLCQHIHGHNYKVVAEVDGVPDSSGMVIDFSDLKKVLDATFNRYDHALVLQTTDPLVDMMVLDGVVGHHRELGLSRVLQIKEPPTAENLARLWFFQLAQMLPHGVRLAALTVFESSNTSARYAEGDE